MNRCARLGEGASLTPVARAVRANLGLYAGLLLYSPLHAATLPAPCVSGACGPSGPAGFVTSGHAGATVTGNTLTVEQTTNQAVLNWQSFNISADGKVIFVQPNASSTALNRIFQASPSQIFGMLQANGNVYLINQNGFIFGSTARVNVGGLLASSLSLDPTLFANGLLSHPTNADGTPAPVLTSDGRAGELDANGNPVLGPDGNPIPVQIVIQQGATLTTNQPNGRLLIAAQSVDNAGTLTAPDGQVLLAAGQKLYLQASTDPSLRGLLVEVDGGGTVTNEIQGVISADRGNVTLLGLAVNQLGRVSATTSVAANGSIRLIAGDTAIINGVALNRTNGGSLTLGADSQTTVLPDTSGGTAVDAQAQLPSTVELNADSIVMQSGSRIQAPGAQVTLTASANPSNATPPSTAPENARIHLDPGAVIDVSGSTSTVPVTRNLVSVQLNSIELANSPDQKGGALLGKTVVVDARADNGKGTSVADVSGAIALTQRDIYERTSAGGTVSFDSTGDVVIAQGATINVSGGQVNYTPGLMQTTQLITANGSLVNIGTASETTRYTGVLNPTYQTTSDRWGVIDVVAAPGISYLDPGYVQGASAGAVSIQAPAMVLNGTFLGQTVSGLFQRTPQTAPAGGEFTIGNPGGAAAADFRAPAISLSASPPVIVVDDSTTLPAGITLQLPIDTLTQGGFSRINLASNGAITIPEGLPLSLPANSSLSLIAPTVNIDAPISTPGGSISVTSSAGAFNTQDQFAGLGISIAPNVVLDVRGLWTNDASQPVNVQPTGFIDTAGGSISLNQAVQSGTLALGHNDALEVSGGAWLARNGTLTGGSGGSVVLNAGPQGTFNIGDGVSFDAYGVSGAKGGSFSLTVPRLEIGSGGSAWAVGQQVTSDRDSGGVFKLDSSLFDRYGFSRFSLTANAPGLTADLTENSLTILPGTSIVLSADALLARPNLLASASSADVFGVTQVGQLPLYERSGESLTLTANDTLGPDGTRPTGGLLAGAGSSITADPGSSIALNSIGILEFAGSIFDPSGSVSLETLTNADLNYLPDVRIQLDRTASIDVSGEAVYRPTSNGTLQGNILAGGSITLMATRGSIVTDPGSLLNFSGSEGPVDVQSPSSSRPPTREVVASAAGSLSFLAPESMSLLGDFAGFAGVGDSGKAAGGTLTVGLSRRGDISGFSIGAGGGFPTTPRVIDFIPNAAPIIQSPDSGAAILDPNMIAKSGVDALTVVADQIGFSNGTTLNLGRSLVLNTPVLSIAPAATANLSAAYLSIGSGLQTAVTPSNSAPGTGTLNFSADSIDLFGSTAVQGAALTTLTSRGQIQLRGNEDVQDLVNIGNFSVAGRLNLAAVDVVPASGVAFSISSSGGTDNSIAISQIGQLSGVPLSAAGAVTITADNITQGGTLVAPFGRITLDATDTLTLAAGSTTSVSGAGATIPYGRVDNGTAWLYGLADNTGGSTIDSVAQAITQVPGRQLTLNGGTVTIAAGATVNVSGGGDLAAYQFTPGTGGTVDALASGTTPGLYAIVPTVGVNAAPYDAFAYAGSGITPGESIYLSAGSGLAPGTYALLPARYALLPGAYLVSLASGYANLQPGTVAHSADGAPIVSGYFTFAGTGTGGNSEQGFIVRPGSYAEKLASYSTVNASTFFPALGTGGPKTVDGGILSITDSTGLLAAGTVSTAAAPGGVNATVELQAPTLEIDPTFSSAPFDGTSRISAQTLSGWAPASLLLGGIYDSSGNLHVGADTVTIASGSSLTGSEIIVAANQGITVQSGATLQTVSASTATDATLASLSTPTPLALTADSNPGAAFLAVSDLNSFLVTRGAAGNSPGRVSIDAGSTVASRGSLTLDAPGGADLASGALMGTHAYWQLGGAQIQFSETAPASALPIDAALVAQLATARGVGISSTGSIDFLEPVALGSGGNSVLAQIGFSAPIIDSTGSSVALAAARITLGNPQPAAVSIASPGTASLQLDASEIDLASGTVALNGFGTVSLTASDRLVGSGGSLIAPGDLKVGTPLLTVVSNTDTSLVAASGQLSVAAPTGAVAGSTGLQTGGTLGLIGESIDIQGTTISLPSGVVSIASTNDLTVGGGARIDVGGILPPGPGIAHGSAGGLITLASGAGNINVDATVNLNVSGASGADAGELDLLAAQSVSLQATLSGAGGSGMLGGSFSMSGLSLAGGFAALNQMLESGGFSELRSIQVQNGDLNLAAGGAMTARHVILSTDTGSIDIAGRIDSSGRVERGSIELAAGGGVHIEDSAVLLANAADANTHGGNILLSTLQGPLSIGTQADIEASAADGTGSLTLRAPATANDVAISSLPARLDRIGSVLIEPSFVSTLSSGTPAAADFTTEEQQVAGFLSANGASIGARLGLASAPNALLEPYVVFEYTGDLVLPALNLATWRFGAAPADVAFRATGNLTVAGSITDGFTPTTFGATHYLAPMTSPSSAITLVAGANLQGARSVAVGPEATSNLELDAGVIVRSGTGDITLAAAQDVTFDSGSSVYTGGIQAAPALAKFRNPVVPTFMSDGGDIRISAGRDVVGAPLAAPQEVTDWLPSQIIGGAATWGVTAQQFGWNVGALGGGDVTVTAARDVTNLSAAVADTALSSATGQITDFGGGNLSVRSGRDIDSNYLYEGLGLMRLRAFGALGTSQIDSGGNPVPTLALGGDASYSIEAVRDLNLAATAPATALVSSANNLAFFFRTGADSYERLDSAGGDVIFGANPASLAQFVGLSAANLPAAFELGTASVDIAAFGGNVSVAQLLAFPSAAGTFHVYGAGNVTGGALGMEDTPAALVINASNPVTTCCDLVGQLFASGAIHTGDPAPATVTAGIDIGEFSLFFPKAVELRAGRDINGVNLIGQNTGANDITLVSAGRDVIDTQLTIGGGGSVDVLAGRNIDFGTTSGATTVGTLSDPNLTTSSGADLNLVAGLSAALGSSQFLNTVVSPSATYLGELVSYVEQVTATSGLSNSQALATFSTLGQQVQQPFLYAVFFNELLLSGRAANNDPGVGFAQGYAAIDALFPDSRSANNPYSGSITLPFSRIYTLDGGNINILAPGGGLNVGLANPPAGSTLVRAASDLGIVTEKSGNINIYAGGDVLVNTSRVFTLDGGNILIWSTTGSIDAGRGAKSSISAAPPRLTVDAAGNVSVDFTSTVAGSGIRTIQTDLSVPPGNVDLDAPVGTVNAGEAGIGSAGNLNIAARSVVNVGNISVGGTSTGVPPEVSGLGVSIAAAASAGGSSSAANQNSLSSGGESSKEAPLTQAALSWLEVFVTGLGEENCRTDDIECLKRQKRN